VDHVCLAGSLASIYLLLRQYATGGT